MDINLEARSYYEGELYSVLSEQPLVDVNQIGLDENSRKKWHHYLTVLTDMDRRKLVGVGKEKNQNVLKDALADMEIRGALSENVELKTMDMSTSYIARISRWMPDAENVFDRFHLEQ
jgi:transposase